MKLSKLKIWALSARPKTLLAALGPVTIGAAMALADGGIHFTTLILTFAAAILIQIGTNFANDYYDFIKGTDTSERTGPTRATQAGLVSPSQMKKAFITTFALAIILGAFLVLRGGLPIVIIGIASVICGILYTAGPFPLGYTGLADLFVLIFFGPVAVGGTYYLQTLDINSNVLIAGLAPGLLATAILTVNNLRDISTDKSAGKKTLAVRFGYNFGVGEYLFCIIAACLIPVLLCNANTYLYGENLCPCVARNPHLFSMISILTLIAAWRPMKKVCSKPSAAELNNLLAQTAMLLIIFSVLFSIGWNI